MGERLVEIGILGRPHGIRGEVRVTYYAESLELLQGAVWLKAGEQPARRMNVLSFRLHQGTPLVQFEGIQDRSAAEILRGQTVLVPESALPDCGDDEIYLYELLGFDVFLEKEGERLGTLDHVHFHGEQELWVITNPGGKEIYLPAVPEFVISIDPETRKICVRPPEGLLELYL